MSSLYFLICKDFFLVNSVDPDQKSHHVASAVGLHCLPLYPFTGFKQTMGEYE